jgi:hypothetical protein
MKSATVFNTLGGFAASCVSNDRAFGLSPLETIAMNGSNFGLSQMYAESHRSDLLREAEHMRRLDEARQRVAPAAPFGGVIAAVRARLGASLVSLGHRLQKHERSHGAETVPTTATLRLAR